ncbi:Uncharacterised protein [Anaerococcus octavius]|uniref:Lipoprotein n=2 Tax=Anaerococcus octavius TaxID=54007 RepID=A0A380WVC9_9FIRM|nr:Uncharacterised protein [Anaerococcus octavius]
MTKKIKYLLGFLFVIFLTACSNSKSQDLSDLIQTPELANPVLEGTWQVSKVEDITDNTNGQAPDIGSKLYIDKNLVAMDDEYAFPPTFTSKYVNLYEYLANRGYDFEKIDKNESAVVVNATQGQFFARDFVIRSEDEIFFIVDDKIVYLSKLAKNVDQEIIDKYTALASKERIDTNEDDEANEDTALLLGVRERTDSNNGKQDYDYYTYFVKINPDGEAIVKKSKDIFLRGQNEYWKVRSLKSKVTGLYDNIEAYPARIENEMNKQENIDKYSFKDFSKDIRINFADMNYISFSYNTDISNNTINKYGVLRTGDLESNKLVNIDEFTGEEDASEQFEEMVINEAASKVSDINPEKIIIDTSDFGLVRDNGIWTIQTSLYTKEGQQRTSSQIPIRNYVEENSSVQTIITRDQVRNINAQEKDYLVLENGNYMIIQTTDEILFHKIVDGTIEKIPFFSIQTPNPTSLISLDQQSGANVESLEEDFISNNEIVD